VRELLKGIEMPVGEEVILKTENARVRIVELGPDEVASLHSHNEVTDNMFCLSGRMSVRMKNPDEEVFLLPGQRCTVAQGRVHQVVNAEATITTYLLVQGVGRYDFNVHKS
jgi:mannose-6-phosphate isomerase-like protein (cupin superfamily)